MVPEEEIPPLNDIRKVMRMMQIRMRNDALHHYSRIDLRTLRALQNLNLYEGEALSASDDVDIDVLQDLTHPRREKMPHGPLVPYATDGGSPQHMVVELPLLLLYDSQKIRKAALGCLEQMIRSRCLSVTPRTNGILRNQREGLVSNDPHEWRPAAVALWDALHDDLLLALHGSRQSLICGPMLKDSADLYASKVLFPTISSLDSMRLGITNPETEHEQLAKAIRGLVAGARTLAEVCSSYFEQLGYLPLAPRYGMAEAVHSWLSDRPDTDAWAEVWDWASSSVGPVPRHHACCVFAVHPELVPRGKLPDLWDEILSVVHESDNEAEGVPGHEAWRLRRDLALHYLYHLEARLPDKDGANIACFAWWLAEQVAALFPDGPEAARFYRENWVQPALEVSSRVWFAASPRIGRAFLRYMTLAVPSPWAVALLCTMGSKLDQLAPGEQSDEVQARFSEALVSYAIWGLPFPFQPPSDPTFALESSLAKTVLEWAERQDEEQRAALEQLVAWGQSLGTPDGLGNALRGIGEISLPEQLVVTAALKAKALTDPAIVEGIWDIVSDRDWRLQVFGNVETQVLGLLIEALTILQVDNRNEWSALLPHYLAEACERTEDKERRRDLFLYVVHTSLASETVSAVRRLLRSDHKDKFLELAKQHRDRVEAMRSEYPPWVAGKLRSLIANLHVV